MNIFRGGIARIGRWMSRGLTSDGAAPNSEPSPLPQNPLPEITEEEWAEHKAKVLAELKAIPEWWNKLADCHVKCSMDEIGKLAHSLWFDFTDEEIVEIYAEAERIRTDVRNDY